MILVTDFSVNRFQVVYIFQITRHESSISMKSSATMYVFGVFATTKARFALKQLASKKVLKCFCKS